MKKKIKRTKKVQLKVDLNKIDKELLWTCAMENFAHEQPDRFLGLKEKRKGVIYWCDDYLSAFVLSQLTRDGEVVHDECSDSGEYCVIAPHAKFGTHED